jgi:protein-L-isoaspartate(D-aspartate) O-methyltransferase
MIRNGYANQRQLMVDSQIIARGIKDERVIDAFLKAPRHFFLDDAFHGQAYDDNPLPIGEKQTISQPYIVALMTEALELKGGERVLEIGTGSGYQTAILAQLAEQVYSIERIPGLAKRARKAFDMLKYTNIVVTIADGTLGWREHAPYDGIIVTAAAPRPPKALLDQLGKGGRMIIPVGDEASQNMMLYIREDDGRFTSENKSGCRFVKLIGEQGWKE